VGHWEFVPRDTVIETMLRPDQRLVLNDTYTGATVALRLLPWRP
jgi:hypothetical protein